MNVCILGYQYTCDDNGVYFEEYNDLSINPFNNVYDLNCSAAEPVDSTQQYQTGCYANGYSKAITQTCSGAVTYSVTAISIISFIFYTILS